MWNTVRMYANRITILQNIFWEFDLSALDFNKYSAFVIERILEKGREEHIKWMFKSYSKSHIKSVLESSTTLSQKTRNFWKLFYQYATF